MSERNTIVFSFLLSKKAVTLFWMGCSIVQSYKSNTFSMYCAVFYVVSSISGIWCKFLLFSMIVGIKFSFYWVYYTPYFEMLNKFNIDLTL